MGSRCGPSFDRRTARASTNKFDDESLRQVVQSSENLAKVQHPDPDLLPMPEAREAAGIAGGGARAASTLPDIFRRRLRSLPSSGRTELGRLFPSRRDTSSRLPGIFSARSRLTASSTPAGSRSWHTQTSAEISITMLAPTIRRAGRNRIRRMSRISIRLGLAEIAARSR